MHSEDIRTAELSFCKDWPDQTLVPWMASKISLFSVVICCIIMYDIRQPTVVPINCIAKVHFGARWTYCPSFRSLSRCFAW